MNTFQKILKAVWDYFRPSWESDDGKFSYRRASQFVFLWLLVVLALRGVDTQYGFYTFLTIAILFGLVAAVITVQQLLVLAKYYSKKRSGGFFGGRDGDDDDITIINNETDTESADALDHAAKSADTR